LPGTSIVERSDLSALLRAVEARGYTPVGPTLRDGAIVYDEIREVEDLPAGWTDEQDGGTYRLRRREDDALFGHAVGPHSWKRFLYPPRGRLWGARRTSAGFEVEPEKIDPPRYAFIGVRACELHAIDIQDRVFIGEAYVDPVYRSRRRGALLIALNCSTPGGTCFCVSMGTGPAVESGYDLALTEVLADDRHYFTVAVGSDAGAEILDAIPHRDAHSAEEEAAKAVVQRAARNMGRSLDTTDIRDLLAENLEHPRWDDVAERCLTCTNCTLVCPTCFCSTVEDVTDLTGERAERWRRWDSCFSLDFSYIHGGSVRVSNRSRYRQWLTHKLGTWIDQFGSSGCVGCGRCITWCPVGIDITEEVAAIRATDGRGATPSKGGDES
jgi:ferredoxin